MYERFIAEAKTAYYGDKCYELDNIPLEDIKRRIIDSMA